MSSASRNSPSPRPAACPEASRRGPTATSGSPRSTATKIGRITPAGSDHRVPTSPPPTAQPVRHHGRAGRQPLVHRVSTANKIGRITPAGRHHRVPPSPRPAADPSGSRPGPDGNLWFTEHRAATRSAGSPRPGVVTEFRRPHRRQRALGHHGRARRQPLVHRAGRQPDRPDHPGRQRSPSSPSPRPAATLRRSRRARTATSGSPSPDGNQIGRITPAGRHHRVRRPHASSGPSASRPGRTATSGSPKLPATGSAGSPRRGVDHRVHAGLTAGSRPDRHHGRARRQPLVHRIEWQPDRPDQGKGWAALPWSTVIGARLPSRW